MSAINVNNGRYQAMIGVGGIGSGVFFALKGDHTLGREESRGGRFLDRRDYCKLHIISHYVNALLGPQFKTILIGKVGDDPAGQALKTEMDQAGLDIRYVATASGEQTLYSICFIYPDGGGGNMTTDDSASGAVGVTDVARVEPEFSRFRDRGVALAAPEVPLHTRQKLLELGTVYGFLRVLALTTAEISPSLTTKMLAQTDLLALNLDEAAALAGMSVAESRPESIVEKSLANLRQINPDMLVSITAGKGGSWSWDGEALVHRPAYPAEVVSTAGAGDAHLAGIISGLVAGLEIVQAQELGTLVAALSITSPHTINPDIERSSLSAFAAEVEAPISDAVRLVLAG